VSNSYHRHSGTRRKARAGGTDAMHLMWVMQVHHIDTDYYDRFFGPGAYGPTHAAHMATWHR
jgi:hypothetical protein